ncbi:MAG: flagellar motor switch protein FliM [Syntrophales bacterium]|nr:flagellar motor switch protein FliM [Syntrophales bacterium]
MSQILSQNEVDALLKGLSDGAIETEKSFAAVDLLNVRPYDLTSHKKIVRERLPSLEITNEKFARLLRSTVSSLLKKVVGINTSSVDMVKYQDFLRTLPFPTSMHIFRMKPLRGELVFIIESKFIFTLVDLLFGGSGRDDFKLEGRDFTSIENNIVQRVVRSTLENLEEAWGNLMEVEVSYIRAEGNPQFAQIVAPQDMVLVTNFELEMDYITGTMTLCIPYSTLEPIREKLLGSYQTDKLDSDREFSSRFRDELQSTEMSISVELGNTELTGRDIMQLKPGDVIILDQYFNDDLSVFLEGHLKFKGQPGRRRGVQAVRISNTVFQEKR